MIELTKEIFLNSLTCLNHAEDRYLGLTKQEWEDVAIDLFINTTPDILSAIADPVYFCEEFDTPHERLYQFAIDKIDMDIMNGALDYSEDIEAHN